jgi:DNA repair photolyase
LFANCSILSVMREPGPDRPDDDAAPPPWLRLRGRGAGLNMTGRFEPLARRAEADGWDMPEEERALRTELASERSTRVITRNRSPDIPFDRSLNPYRGCEHGCIYCYARPSHAWLGLSPGLDFETRLVAKPDAPAALARELQARGYCPRPIAIGSNTDPYQPVEAGQRLTRQVLEVLRDFGHPAVILTRGTLIERDLDILSEMARRRLVRVGVSVTTLDAGLARRMEPRAPAPARRLATIGALARAGVPVRVMVSPVIPGLTDHEIEAILAAAAEAGAQAASWIMLRLPHEVAPLFRDWLAQHAPGRADKVMARLREMHGGRDYDAAFGHRMRGEGVHARLIARRFEIAARRLGLDGQLPKLRTDLFAVPLARDGQLSLFQDVLR